MFIGRYANDVMMATLTGNTVLFKPCIHSAGIRQSFPRGKSLGRYDNQCRTGIALSQNTVQSNPVGCRQKVQTNGFISFHQGVINRTHTGF